MHLAGDDIMGGVNKRLDWIGKSIALAKAAQVQEEPWQREERERQRQLWEATIELCLALPECHQRGMLALLDDDTRWPPCASHDSYLIDGYRYVLVKLETEANHRLHPYPSFQPTEPVVILERALRESRLYRWYQHARKAKETQGGAAVATVHAEWKEKHERFDGPLVYWEHWEGNEYWTRDRWIATYGQKRPIEDQRGDD